MLCRRSCAPTIWKALFILSPSWGRLVLLGTLAALFSASCGGGGGSADGGAVVPSPAPEGAALVTIQGVITAAPYLAVDSSVNDPQTPYRSNREFFEAQLIGNPVLLGGYVTRHPTGVAGDRFERSDNRYDTFLVSLAAGQRVTLYVSDFARDEREMDLLLRDAGHTGENGLPLVVDSSLGEQVLQVTAPEDGQYFLDVQAHAGASKYVLAVGSMPSLHELGLPETLRSHLEVVAGEAIVTLREAEATLQEPETGRRLAPSSRGLAAGQALAAELGMRAAGGGPGREHLLRLDGPGGSAAVLERLGVVSRGLLHQEAARPSREALPETIRMVRALARHPQVARATPNYLHRLQRLPNDPHLGLQWHFHLSNLPAAWELTTGARDTVVAVVDSGVFLNHPDLAANLTTNGSPQGDGWNFVNCAPPQDCSSPDDPGDGIVPGSSSWHGTHVAGTVAAVTDNAAGVAGAAWNVSLMPVRVCGQGGTCSSYAVLQGVRYAAGLPNDSGRIPQRPADVINLSLGGPAFENAAAALYQQVCEAGIVVVAAAGNNNSSSPLYPAAYPCVFSVSALDARSQRAPYSNFGPSVDLAAPGGHLRVDLTGDGHPDGVLSTLVDDRSGSRQPSYGFMQGTSMAAPHVSGIMALMRSLNPDVTPAHLRAWLEAGLLTEPLAGAAAGVRTSEFGYGRVDALRAVTQALGEAPPVLVGAPALLTFQAGAPTGPLAFTLRSVGGSLQVVEITSSSSWLTISAQEVDEAGLGTYLAAVDAGALLSGNYTAQVIATADNGATAVLPVTLRVPGPAEELPPDAGVHHVLLVSEDLQTRFKALVQGSDGEYHFKLEAAVEPGYYYIVAGSDLDNDQLVCTPGEACGAYPTAEQPKLVRVRAGRREINDIDFITTFGTSLSNMPAQQAIGSFASGLRRDSGHPVRPPAPHRNQ